MMPRMVRFLVFATVILLFVCLGAYLPDFTKGVSQIPGLSRNGYRAHVNRLTGYELCTDRAWLAGMGRPDAWFGLKGNEASPHFPHIVVFLDPNLQGRRAADILADFSNDTRWSIIHLETEEDSLIFTLYRTDAEPPAQFYRYCFKLKDDVIIRMIATWSGQPTTPAMLDEAFHNITAIEQ